MEVAGMTGWKPVLKNGSTDALKNVLEQVDKDMIAKYLNETSFAGLPSGAMAGVSGELLYLFYSASYYNNDATYDLAFEKLEQLISDIDINTSLTFCSGLCGLLWTLYHLDNIDLVPDAGSMIDEETIDMLYQKWMPALANGDYDFMHGGMSLALPLLACRKKTDKHRQYLEAMVDALDKSAIKKDDMAWWLYIIDARKSNETGISFGMSHGLPGIIALLSKIHMQGIAEEKCVTLIRQLLNTILNNRNTSEFKNYLFAANLRLDGKKEPFPSAGRMAWCYGDANIAIALLYAYKVTGTAEYLEEAHTILHHISYYTAFNCQYVFDADFCHGAFGNAHILCRLYNVTGMDELADGARFWYTKGLEKVKIEDGALKFLHVDDKIATWTAETSVINGKAGIGLAIMSALSDTAPDWDDMFLLNI